MGGVSSEVGEVVLVGFADFSEEAMKAESFEEMRDLAGGFAEFLAEVFVAQAGDDVFPPKEGLE